MVLLYYIHSMIVIKKKKEKKDKVDAEGEEL